MSSRALHLVGALVVGLCAAPLLGQQPDDMRARYERALTVDSQTTWVLNQRVVPRWIDDARFYYERATPTGKRFTLVDARAKQAKDLFDHVALARALAGRVDSTFKPAADSLALRNIVVAADLQSITFAGYGKAWRLQLRDNSLDTLNQWATDVLVSPDKKRGVFQKDNNLWLRDLTTGKDVQLTTDGVPAYGYGHRPMASYHTSPNGMPSRVPSAVWSADSRRLLTVQTDDRQVLDMPMIDFAPKDGSVRPKPWSARTALPGDANVTQFRLVAIDVDTKRQVGAHYTTIPATRMNDTPIEGNRAWWSADNRHAYFVEVERGERRVNVVDFDTQTGDTRVVLTETSPTYVDIGPSVYGAAAILPLPATNQLVWYSERSGRAHLYLYDMRDGRMVRQLTQGDWLVREIAGFDSARRDIFFTAGERPGKDPYYREFAKVNVDAGDVTFLSRGDADYAPAGTTFLGGSGSSTVSPGGSFYVETIQRADRPNKTLVRDRDGNEVFVVVEPDASRVPKWWRWPEPVQLKAADGQTVISGLVFRPSNFSPDKKYPVIDHLYGGPQVSIVPESFSEGHYMLSATLAEAGFIVVMIDGRGTAERNKAFHDASYGHAQTASNLEDHIAGMRQLAAKYPYMDLNRVGVTGFSGGGYMTAIAMFRFPEFYKVGVASSGNFDQRFFWHSWGERYQGLVDGDNYKDQAAVTYVKDFKGKILFTHGLQDIGVHSGGLFQLIQAMINANKDYDLMVFPQLTHEGAPYLTRRMLDYFVTNLAGGTPPAQFDWRPPRIAQ